MSENARENGRRAVDIARAVSHDMLAFRICRHDDDRDTDDDAPTTSERLATWFRNAALVAKWAANLLDSLGTVEPRPAVEAIVEAAVGKSVLYSHAEYSTATEHALSVGRGYLMALMDGLERSVEFEGGPPTLADCFDASWWGRMARAIEGQPEDVCRRIVEEITDALARVQRPGSELVAAIQRETAAVVAVGGSEVGTAAKCLTPEATADPVAARLDAAIDDHDAGMKWRDVAAKLEGKPAKSYNQKEIARVKSMVNAHAKRTNRTLEKKSPGRTREK